MDFKRPDDPYRPVTHLSTIYAIYESDRRFRNLMLGVIDPNAISIRTKIAQHLAGDCDPLACPDPAYFVDSTYHANQLATIDTEITRSREPLADHYRQYYGGTFPIWVTVAMMSFGSVSKM